jgi:hypothetical protein
MRSFIPNSTASIHPDDRMVAVRYFSHEPEARVYAARLKAAGIPCYLSSTYALTALPLTGNGIGLHVWESDLAEAYRVFVQVDRETRRRLAEQSFHDADHEEIEYQKRLNAPASGLADRILWAIVLLLVLVFLLRVVFPGAEGLHFQAW